MDNITFRKRIEEYRKRSIEQKKYESKLNYQWFCCKVEFIV
ncbi:hypothetical protein [Staphylococcus capitis]